MSINFKHITTNALLFPSYIREAQVFVREDGYPIPMFYPGPSKVECHRLRRPAYPAYGKIHGRQHYDPVPGGGCS